MNVRLEVLNGSMLGDCMLSSASDGCMPYIAAPVHHQVTEWLHGDIK
jgi:hypothetical protein